MEILLIEDSKEKENQIKEAIYQHKQIASLNITTCSALDCAIKFLCSKKFDLIVFDFYLPLSTGEGTSTDVSLDLVNYFSDSQNCDTESIAITMYDLKSIDMDRFNAHGVTVVQYCNDSNQWESSLKKIVHKVVSKPKFDFLIFCALMEERIAYKKTSADIGNLLPLKGINCQEISIGKLKGLCIVPPRMGPVNTAISVAKSIDYFQPRFVAMSGMCAGFSGKVGLLDIIIADHVWDYSVGKITDEGFKQEPYQRSIDNDLRMNISQIIEKGDILQRLKDGILHNEVSYDFDLKLGPVVSGSAVIASRDMMSNIEIQHRKVIGLDMEISSLYEAAAQSPLKPLFLAAKSVVDTGDEKKDDSVHEIACILSAKFLVEVIERIFAST